MLNYKFSAVWDKALNNCLDKIDAGLYIPQTYKEDDVNYLYIRNKENELRVYIKIYSIRFPFPCALVHKINGQHNRYIIDNYRFRPSIKTLFRVRKLFKKMIQDEFKQNLLDYYGDLL